MTPDELKIEKTYAAITDDQRLEIRFNVMDSGCTLQIKLLIDGVEQSIAITEDFIWRIRGAHSESENEMEYWNS